MSFLSKIWAVIRTPTSRLVGRDLRGNKFYEKDAPELGRPKRTVVWKNTDDMWDHQKRLPIQWSSWLSHTRAHAPTLEELQADAERQLRVQYNASLIEARDKEEVETMKRLQAETHAKLVDAPMRDAQASSSTSTPAEALQDATPSSETRSNDDSSNNTPSNNPWDAAKSAPDTESWTPRPRRRGP